MSEFAADLCLVESVDLAIARTILTNIARSDRFCDGYMADMFENGMAQAATRRLVQISGE
jgi:hypothetical protein